MDIDRPALAAEGIAPDLVEELFPRQHQIPVPQQKQEHLKFLVGQSDALAVDLCDVLLRQDNELSQTEALRCLGLLRAPEKCPYTGDQLHHAEGLGKVIVCAGIEPDDLVIFTAAGSEHHDGDVGSAPVAAQLA